MIMLMTINLINLTEANGQHIKEENIARLEIQNDTVQSSDNIIVAFSVLENTYAYFIMN